MPNSWAFKYVKGYFYFANDFYFYSTYSNFTLIAQSSNTTYYAYRGLYYSANTSFFYASSQANQNIDIYDTDCVNQGSISTGLYIPISINGLDNNLFVGTATAQVLLINNNFITKVFYANSCLSSIITSINFDPYSNLIIGCQGQNQIAAYDFNGNFLDSILTVSPNLEYAVLDSKGRLFIAGDVYFQVYA